MDLTQNQNRVFERIKAFLDSDASVFILRGYAGTGKTTMVQVVADYIAQHHDVRLMAPTGRAARVLSQKTGHVAVTIHKAIYGKACVVPKESDDVVASEYKLVFPICNDDHKIVAIVDEASMVCSRKMESELFVFGTDNLLEDLLTFVRPSFGGKIIFVGDPAQLPPVGESVSSALRKEYFEERGLEVYEEELTEVLRQRGESVILKNAMMIRDLLQSERRNHFVFAEKENDVETVRPEDFLRKYLEYRKQSPVHDSVIICFSNKSAARYNKEIRLSLYGGDVPIREGDVLLITQNNYRLGRMNGEFVPVLSVGARIQQSAPVYIQEGGEKKRVTIELNFVQVTVTDGMGNPMQCMLLEDLLTSDNATISIDESRALYVNFCMRNRPLKPGTEAFTEALLSDPFYNAIRAKYGYAVTGHKCQGGEWGKVFVDYTGRTGLSDDCLRWAYTATTRAQKTLYVTNLPHITPFSRFRIDSIQKCRNMNPECRIVGDTASTPFHADSSMNFLKAKYWCIMENMVGTPYRVVGVMSLSYMERYQIETPLGVDSYDIRYKEGGLFSRATTLSFNEHTSFVLELLNNERRFPFVFNYTPSNDLYEKLYNMIRSACDGLSIQITNVVEHLEAHHVVYYMRTCNSFSCIMVYINDEGYVTYAKPMSMLGTDDNELIAVINEISNHFME